jgi:SAM-dependent methyltransferase
VALDLFPRVPGAVRGDVRALPFPGGAFEVVLCDSVLDTWTGTSPACGIRELMRVLKPGGLLLLVMAAAEGSEHLTTSRATTREELAGWTAGLETVELLYARVEYPLAAGVRAQWALAARRPG